MNRWYLIVVWTLVVLATLGILALWFAPPVQGEWRDSGWRDLERVDSV